MYEKIGKNTITYKEVWPIINGNLTYKQWRIYKRDWEDISPGPEGKKAH
jgi:hypothetical protein